MGPRLRSKYLQAVVERADLSGVDGKLTSIVPAKRVPTHLQTKRNLGEQDDGNKNKADETENDVGKECNDSENKENLRQNVRRRAV